MPRAVSPLGLIHLHSSQWSNCLLLNCCLVLSDLQPIFPYTRDYQGRKKKNLHQELTFFFLFFLLQTSPALFCHLVSNHKWSSRVHILCNSVSLLWNHNSSRYSNYASLQDPSLITKSAQVTTHTHTHFCQVVN